MKEFILPETKKKSYIQWKSKMDELIKNGEVPANLDERMEFFAKRNN